MAALTSGFQKHLRRSRPSSGCWVLVFPLLLSLGFLLYPAAIYFTFGFLCLYSVSESKVLSLKENHGSLIYGEVCKRYPNSNCLELAKLFLLKDYKIFSKTQRSPTYLTFPAL